MEAARPLLQVIGVDDPDAWAFAVPWHRAMGHASLICVPLFAGERALGFMGLCFATPDAIAPARVELAQALANQAALALELTRLADEVREAAVAHEREQAIQERAAELARANAALKRSVTRLAGGGDLAGFLDAVLAEAAGACGAKSAAVFAYAPESDTLRKIAFVTGGERVDIATDPRMALWREPVPARLTDAWPRVLSADGVFWFDNEDPPPEHWPLSVPWHRAMGHRTIATIPLTVGERPLGFLGLCFGDDRRPTEARLEQARALAGHAALAMQLTRLADEAREAALAREREAAAEARAAELGRVNQVLRRVVGNLAEASYGALDDAFLRRTVVECCRATGAVNAALFLRDEAGGFRTCLAPVEADGTPVPLAGQARAVFEADTFARHSRRDERGLFARLLAGEVILAHPDDAAGPLSPEAAAWHAAHGHKAVLNVPMLVGARVVGYLGLAFNHAAKPDVSAIELLRALAAQAALAAELGRLAGAARDAAVAREREAAARGHAARLAGANQALARSAARLTADPELEPFLRTVLDEAAGQAGAFAAALMLYDAEAHVLSMRLYVREGEVLDVATDPRMALWREPVPADLGPAWAELSAGHPVTHLARAGDRYTWPHTVAWHAEMGHAMVVAVPLLAGERALGFMGLSFRHQGPVAPAALELAQALASQAVLGLELTSLADASRRAAVEAAVTRERGQAAQDRAAELARANAALRRTTARLAEQADLHAFFGQALGELADQLGARTGALFLHDAEADTLSLSVAVLEGVEESDPASDPQLAPWAAPLPAGRVPGWAALLRDRRPVLVDLEPDGQAIATAAWYAQRGLSVALRVPLIADGTTLGFMSLAFAGSPALPPEQVELAQALGHQAALAVQLGRLHERAREGAVNEERARAAREIHDTLAQCFTSIFLQLQAAADLALERPEQARACMLRAEQLARDGLVQARQSVGALMPDAAEFTDLPGTLRVLCERATAGTAIPASLTVRGKPRALPPEVGRNLLRIAQEALGNAQRYAGAGASRIHVTLSFGEGSVALAVKDDGAGFFLGKAEGHGLANMRGRAERIGGTLAIQSAPGQGTRIVVRARTGRPKRASEREEADGDAGRGDGNG